MRNTIIIGLLLCASAASAETLSCEFTTECFETESCQHTDYAFDVTYQPKQLGPKGMVARADFVDQSKTIGAMFAQRGTTRVVLVGDVFDGVETKSVIGPDGRARHIVFDGESLTIIVYHGTCGALK